MTTRVAVIGANGTMGSLAVRLIEESSDFDLFAAIGSRDPLDGMIGADLVVDFTVPAVSVGIVDFAVEHGINALVGTSGWSSAKIVPLARRVEAQPGVGVVIVPNFSIGSMLATRFSTMAALFFDSIEIVETHHAQKVDSPSGTAVRTAELIGAARSEAGPVIAPHVDQRARGQQVASVPIHSLRMQGVVAKQDVHFGGTGETVTVSHETLSAASYEDGILLAMRAAVGATGVTVGLDAVIGLDALLAGPSTSTGATP